jgi:hypothetical protein
MSTKHIFFTIILIITLIPVQLQAEAPTGQELAQKVYDYDLGNNAIARMSMELKDADGSSRMRKLVNMTSDEGDIRKSMIRFLEPADIAGTGFLSIEQENGDTRQFLYLPALDRTRRIVSSQKGRSFVNSDFTYEDMQRRPVHDFEHEIVGQDTTQGHECWVLEQSPLSDTESQYALIKSWIPKNIALPIQVYFYTSPNTHSKTYKVPELEEIQGIWTPMQMIMTSHEDGHQTILRTREIKYNSPQVQDSYFSTRYLEGW